MVSVMGIISHCLVSFKLDVAMELALARKMQAHVTYVISRQQF